MSLFRNSQVFGGQLRQARTRRRGHVIVTLEERKDEIGGLIAESCAKRKPWSVPAEGQYRHYRTIRKLSRMELTRAKRAERLTDGEAAFDTRSFRLNLEVAAVIAEGDFSGEMEQMFERDFAHAEPIDPDDPKTSAFWWRLGENLSRLAAPML